jgi:hypothetical protein
MVQGAGQIVGAFVLSAIVCCDNVKAIARLGCSGENEWLHGPETPPIGVRAE